MTKEELDKIFQEVAHDFAANPENFKCIFKKHCKADASGHISDSDIMVAMTATMVEYNQNFLFQVLSRALCKD